MRFIYLTVFGMLMTGSAFAQRSLIYCGNLFDGVSGKTRSSVTVVVEKNKIISIADGFTAASGTDKIIDLKSKTVLPGLIDMHVHLEGETSKDQFQKRMQYNMADVAFEAQKNGLTTLMAGFTTVRDLGGSGANIALRNAINKGTVTGPRILTSGKTIATTGGHGDPSNGIKPDLHLPEAALDGVVNSPDEARQAIRQRYKDGTDWIKITATGGVLSIAKNGKGPQFQPDELKALIETANDYGFKVAAHAHGAEGMKRALRAGVTTIEHGSFLDDECIKLFVEKGAYLIPTIIAGKTVADSAKIPGYYHPFVVPKALETGVLIQQSFAKAYKAGVKIGFGTDAGVFVHGRNAKEFVYMTEVGMPMNEALLSATKTNSQILGMQDQIGSIEAGKLADIIAVDADPLKDPTVMMNVSFVMKDGVVYKE
ncbi:amidohydrolase family protein [Dyadobacter sp. CY312]|uniref:metal-dependent hydrolase family protein n=1 Tax=Dyadobacter sp. CY312 TaxID=2907303 RepID=UPI001F160C19|nr:amidohydrolase family protein [Dyadobacter sp. CY312]MCE7040735.1 amidohydrolase family protein [Dyadobacter sp. CY312]